MNTLWDVKQRVRALIGDPDADFATDAYLLPLINQAYDQAINVLAGTCSPYMTQLQVCPNVPQGTTTLQQFQAVNSPLFGLVNPLEMEVKQVGQPEANYVFARRLDILPNVSVSNPQQPSLLYWGGLAWEWRSYIIYITTLPYPADIRIRGEFRPPALVKDTDIIAIHPLMTVALAYATAALIGGERINASYVQNYGQQAERTIDDVAAELVRSTQGTTSRVGRMNRGRGISRGRGYF